MSKIQGGDIFIREMRELQFGSLFVWWFDEKVLKLNYLLEGTKSWLRGAAPRRLEVCDENISHFLLQ